PSPARRSQSATTRPASAGRSPAQLTGKRSSRLRPQRFRRSYQLPSGAARVTVPQPIEDALAAKSLSSGLLRLPVQTFDEPASRATSIGAGSIPPLDNKASSRSAHSSAPARVRRSSSDDGS